MGPTHHPRVLWVGSSDWAGTMGSGLLGNRDGQSGLGPGGVCVSRRRKYPGKPYWRNAVLAGQKRGGKGAAGVRGLEAGRLSSRTSVRCDLTSALRTDVVGRTIHRNGIRPKRTKTDAVLAGQKRGGKGAAGVRGLEAGRLSSRTSVRCDPYRTRPWVAACSPSSNELPRPAGPRWRKTRSQGNGSVVSSAAELLSFLNRLASSDSQPISDSSVGGRLLAI